MYTKPIRRALLVASLLIGGFAYHAAVPAYAKLTVPKLFIATPICATDNCLAWAWRAALVHARCAITPGGKVVETQSGERECLLPAKDGNKPCSDSSQCTYYCVPDPGKTDESKHSNHGHCARYNNPSCASYIREGNVYDECVG